jgi:ParB family chromosome partitioning protein
MRFRILPLKEISTKGYQVRFESGRENIEDLIESIRENGLICPLTVSKRENKYYLISGNRRLKAIKKLGWKELPCAILEEIGDEDLLIKSIVENIERLNLTPLERAKGFQELRDAYKIKEEEIAKKTGRTQSDISNHLRLLKRLHHKVLEYLHKGKITFGHAKVLMGLEDKNKQLSLAKEVIKRGLSVEDTMVLVDLARPGEELTEREKELNAIERDIMRHLRKEWKKKINIRTGKKEEKLLVSFSSRKELKGLLSRLSQAL